MMNQLFGSWPAVTRRLMVLSTLLCTSASFYAYEGATVADAARHCRMGRSAFLSANSDIVGWWGEQPYLHAGYTYTCVAPQLQMAYQPIRITDQWSPWAPYSPPAPTISAIQRGIANGQIVVTWNPERPEGTRFFRSSATGETFAKLEPTGSVIWFGNSRSIGSWTGVWPPATEVCGC
jgi:hypothetical protein